MSEAGPTTVGVTPTGTPEICDLIMKGGIASGIVCPPAIIRLSRKYVSTSAAPRRGPSPAAAAAAEYGRQSGGFEKLAGMCPSPQTFSGSVPADTTLPPVFRAFLAVIGARDPSEKPPPSAGTGQWLWRNVCSVHRGLLVGALAVFFYRPWEAWFLAGLVLATGVIWALVWSIKKVITRELPGHDFGICGMSPGRDGTGLSDAWPIRSTIGRPPHHRL